jgi:hypothetical protein
MIDEDGRDSVELVPVKASAGYLRGYADPEYMERLPRMKLPFLPSGKHRAFPIKGDSMPPIKEGSFVVAKYLDRIEDIKKDISKIESNKDKWKDASNVIYSKKELLKQLENDIKYVDQYGDEILQSPDQFRILRTERPNLVDYNNAFSFNSKLNKFIESKGKDVMSSKKGTPEGEKLLQDIIELQKNNLTDNKPIIDYLQKNHPDFFEPDRYAHYIHLGTPGEKILQPIKSWEITPETWKNKSRAHTNEYSKKLSALEKGGIVKDDNGYWNPENWGKPVEIGSNEITMQGVDQDLIGISDEGDVQLLKANNPKNYKFKGKKVTEFPVSKNGGWLDKYN